MALSFRDVQWGVLSAAFLSNRLVGGEDFLVIVLGYRKTTVVGRDWGWDGWAVGGRWEGRGGFIKYSIVNVC